ncbi:MAG TPA: PAS domain-containing protein, partial [Azonexus sp.]|nr:PAS domain-containing protein [Azonexus sp.]
MGGCLEDKDSETLLPYEALLENIAHIVYRLDLVSGRFEYISGAASKLFGLELDAIREAGADLVGRHMVPGDY